jgi:uncharacterized SAM-binding protein YcdF (DUF218 family)
MESETGGVELEACEINAIEDIFTYLSENRPEGPIENFPFAEAIFIPRHFHPQVIEHGIKLWKMKKAEKIIISGKVLKGWPTVCDYVSSALEAGIQEDSIFVEDKATNILDEVLNGIGMCHEKKFFPHSLTVCAFPPKLQRTYATFQKHFPKIHVYGTGFKMNVMEHWCTRLSHIHRLLGELNRIRECSKRGDISEVKIPTWVISSEKKVANKIVKKIQKALSV